MSREKILIRTSWVSTIGNAILSASKIIVGLFAGSLAVLGDGIDSATDVIISIVMIFTALQKSMYSAMRKRKESQPKSCRS